MSNKLLAEGFGTFTLALTVLLSVTVIDSVLVTPVLAALVLGLFVYSIGSVSGCHINPAVTLGLWSIGKVSTGDSVMYIVAQVVGALAAFLVVAFTVGGVALGMGVESTTVLIAEFVGTALFTFGIASVVYGNVSDHASGLVIGGSLLLGIVTAVHLGSGGLLNPAVGVALGMVSVTYIAGAVLGAIAGMQLYKCLSK